MQTPFKLIILSILTAIALLAGCANQTNLQTVESKDTDANILEIIATVDKGEMAAAIIAQHKNTNKVVKAYAAWLYQEHNNNLKQILQLQAQLNLPAGKSKIAAHLAADGRKELAKLNQLNNRALDVAYINAMVKGHTAGLHLIDDKLLKEVQDPYIKQELAITRTMVYNHLQRALAIKQEMDF